MTLYSCGQDPAVVISANTRVTDASHASVAVGMSKDGVAGHSTEVIPGNELITGAVTSLTTMERLQVAVFPQSSVAVHVRVAV